MALAGLIPCNLILQLPHLGTRFGFFKYWYTNRPPGVRTLKHTWHKLWRTRNKTDNMKRVKRNKSWTDQHWYSHTPPVTFGVVRQSPPKYYTLTHGWSWKQLQNKREKWNSKCTRTRVSCTKLFRLSRIKKIYFTFFVPEMEKKQWNDPHTITSVWSAVNKTLTW